MKTNELKNSKGITLISLVVTIIVLLILAGVSISVLTGENGIINRTTEAKTTSAIARVEELANLELANSLIGVRAGLGETEKTIPEILTILEQNKDIEANSWNLRDDVTITSFDFGETSTVNLAKGGEATTLTANFTTPPGGEGAYYIIIEGKKYPISKENRRVTIGKNPITTNGGSAKITGITQGNTNIATASITGEDENQITITPGNTRGSTTITVSSGTLTPIVLTINVKGTTEVTASVKNNTGGSVSPTAANPQEGTSLELTATPTAGYKVKGWYVGSDTTSRGTGNTFTLQIPSGENYVTSIAVSVEFEVSASELTDDAKNPGRFGSKIAYGVDLDGNTSTADWKIFYEDNSYIYIIAADYVSATKLNAIMDNDGDSNKGTITRLGATTNSQYNVYWSNATDFKTSKGTGNIDAVSTYGAQDIFTNKPTGTNSLLGKGFLKFWKDAMDATGAAKTITTNDNANARMTATLMDTKVWEPFAAGYSEAFAIGGPTLSMWVESWNANTQTQKATKLYYNRASSTGYYVKAGSQPSTSTSNYSVNLSSNTDYTGIASTDNNYTDDLYFPHKGSSAWNSCWGYCLASPSARGADAEMRVYFSGLVDFHSYGNGLFGVRPVVCLPSNVPLSLSNGVYTIGSGT